MHATPNAPASVQVRNLEIRVPTIEAPGSDGGFVQTRYRSTCRADYTLALNVAPGAPSAPHLTSGSTPNANGEFTLAWESSQAATSPTYTLQHKNNYWWLGNGRQRSDEPRIHIRARATPRPKARGTTA